uniref:Glutamate ionotropic receptor kainate type subunit 5 n=1 Tax=Molossus molossus TaxID=27622 RepID=A0A7J8C7I3_MOLMO|nr:glutamate ionotropic receptor kainate type subunit 5 [Molossus molossus]
MPAELLLLLIVAFASPSCQVLSSLRMAAILDDQTVCGRGERLALALAREQINGIIEVPAKARVEVDIFELQRDSQYETTDTSEQGHGGMGVSDPAQGGRVCPGALLQPCVCFHREPYLWGEGDPPHQGGS